MAADETVQVALRKSTVEMIRGYDLNAASLDDAIEEMILDQPPAALLKELDREAEGPFVSRDVARRKHGR
jgi:hypothetical protein